jgi:hypothetical protein
MIAVVAITVIFHALIASWLSKSYNLKIPSMGTIYVTGVEAYGGDINSTNGSLTVDWGVIQVGSSNSVSFYLRSVSNVPVILALSPDNWVPRSIEPFMPVSWNYTGNQIAPGEEISIRIDLKTTTTSAFVDYIVSNKVTFFSFSLNICSVQP